MFLKLTGIYGELVVINSDKIICFHHFNDGTRLWLDGNDDEPTDVVESLEDIMEYLQD